MHVGVADHLGWAIVVVADDEHRVVDRRRIELVEDGLSQAPIHYDRGQTDDATLADLIELTRRSIARVATSAFDALPGPITTLSLRRWPPDFPTDLATQRRTPYEARADAIMYRGVLADLAHTRGWQLHTFDARSVEQQARDLVGDGPFQGHGTPWTKDHRTALAAAILATG